jgi:2,4-dienoyl-CoA reductase-like NADH-dependent reductase (Old Yellow Enzyme family)
MRSDPFSRAALGPITVPNRIVKAATFGGMVSKNVVTEDLIDFHRAVVAGGVGMTTLAYCAVSLDGQGAPGEIIVREEAVPGLRRFVEAMHELEIRFNAVA